MWTGSNKERVSGMTELWDWISKKAWHGFIYLAVYFSSAVILYSASAPPDRSGDGFFGTCVSLLEDMARGFLMFIVFLNPVVVFFALRAITALILAMILYLANEKGRDIEKYSSHTHVTYLVFPIITEIILYLALSLT